jgi:hypothetical protein
VDKDALCCIAAAQSQGPSDRSTTRLQVYQQFAQVPLGALYLLPGAHSARSHSDTQDPHAMQVAKHSTVPGTNHTLPNTN